MSHEEPRPDAPHGPPPYAPLPNPAAAPAPGAGAPPNPAPVAPEPFAPQASAAARQHNTAHTLDQALPPLNESDYLSTDPRVEQAFSRRIDLYYNTPLDIFPYAETNSKPDRFHVMFKRQIQERFPDEEGVRERVSRYGRWVFKLLTAYMFGKRGMQAAAIIGYGALALWGAGWVSAFVPDPVAQQAAAALLMLVWTGVYFGVNAIIFVQYRTTLENRSYVLSREIVQHTRELQNLYTTIRALPDQSETLYQTDGPGWGRRSAFLVRMLMWLGARMEYLEKYIQVAMWRVRRERYWMTWVGRFFTLVVLIWGGWWISTLPVPAGGDIGFRALQGLALLLAAGVSWASYFFWQTPLNLVTDKLNAESWVRYSTLDLDNTVGDQVRRDKERLVEYRHLTRGRG